MIAIRKRGPKENPTTSPQGKEGPNGRKPLRGITMEGHFKGKRVYTLKSKVFLSYV